MEAIRSELAQLKELETELSHSKWAANTTGSSGSGSGSGANQNRSTSPRGLVDVDDNDNATQVVVDNASLIQRYEQARDLYLQRRLENLLVDHIATFDEGEFVDLMSMSRDSEEDKALQQRHARALATLEGSMDKIHAQTDKLRATREAVASRRQELEQMVQDMEDDRDDGDGDDTTMEYDESDTVDDTAVASEQERMEQLQERKRKLQDELAKIQIETQEAQERTRFQEKKLAVLKQDFVQQEGGKGDPEGLQKKVDELREIKSFYDSLREVLEELGGVKIVKVEEEPVHRHLFLTLAFYEEYQVQIELEVYRKVFLKLVNAKWISQPVVRAKASTVDESTSDETKKEDFFLTMDPLDDLVQVAKTALGPPHDLRLVVRETLARIRIFQDRVEELAVLRRHVLTKVHNGNQVVCSLNEGIVIVMRLYEKYIRLDQIVGIGGWEEGTTKKIQAAVMDKLDKEYQQDDADILLYGSKVTPMIIVQCVQDELEQLQNNAQNGWTNPVTPRFPERKGVHHHHHGGF
jgi:hypothetical protein